METYGVIYRTARTRTPPFRGAGSDCTGKEKRSREFMHISNLYRGRTLLNNLSRQNSPVIAISPDAQVLLCVAGFVPEVKASEKLLEVPPPGFEPGTTRSSVWRSPSLSYRGFLPNNVVVCS